MYIPSGMAVDGNPVKEPPLRLNVKEFSSSCEGASPGTTNE
ncbi:predicted protein [Botrytis cinerea T4]|uniref:Uncharacterized protein n=1 Tax=Botryotinia fuckeliana (strain T4) TaxID=999810 RepID=G2XX26_BOTF4|nr:predicted protein [Botrytis cinerea T4]